MSDMMFCERYLKNRMVEDASKKLLLLSGPRQVGKTTLSKNLFANSEYLNWDSPEDRPRILGKKWDRSKAIIVLDELHKMKAFKSFLKGVFDSEGVRPAIVVTGSARLDTTRKLGDSLAGRFFPFRLAPLDLWELRGTAPVEDIYNRLLTHSGFPEPYFESENSFYPRWAKTHMDIILRQDLLDLEAVRSINGIETLVALLQTRVGSTVSYSSLSRDLGCDPKTVRHWLMLLENLFVVFRVPPFHRNIARSLLKEPKYYFYDTARVRGTDGAKFENVVALSLKKQLDYLGDVHGRFGNLNFLRTKDGREIDFMIDWDDADKAPLLIEVKTADTAMTPHWNHFHAQLAGARFVQLVRVMSEEKVFPTGERIVPALKWLSEMPLTS